MKSYLMTTHPLRKVEKFQEKPIDLSLRPHEIDRYIIYYTRWFFYHETFIISKSINIFENFFLHSLELLKNHIFKYFYPYIFIVLNH